MRGRKVTDGQSLRVRVGSTVVGLPLSRIGDVHEINGLVPVPLARAAVRGLASHRGRVTCVLSLATLLGIDADADAEPVGVSVAWAGQAVSLEVDAVEGIASGPDAGKTIDVIALLENTFANTPGVQL